MFCFKDQRPLAYCTCLDLAERVGNLAEAGGHFACRWCMRCDQHYSLCKCDEPMWGIKVEGKVTAIPTEGQDAFRPNGRRPVFPTELQPVFDKTREIRGMTKVRTKSGSEYVFRSENGQTFLTRYTPSASSHVEPERIEGAVVYSEYPIEPGFPLQLRLEKKEGDEYPGFLTSTVIEDVDLDYREEE